MKWALLGTVTLKTMPRAQVTFVNGALLLDQLHVVKDAWGLWSSPYDNLIEAWEEINNLVNDVRELTPHQTPNRITITNTLKAIEVLCTNASLLTSDTTQLVDMATLSLSRNGRRETLVSATKSLLTHSLAHVTRRERQWLERAMLDAALVPNPEIGERIAVSVACQILPSVPHLVNQNVAARLISDIYWQIYPPKMWLPTALRGVEFFSYKGRCYIYAASPIMAQANSQWSCVSKANGEWLAVESRA